MTRRSVLVAMAVVVAQSWLLSTGAAAADLRLPNIFGDHMVLQRARPARVWGWAGRGERVTVRFAGQNASATTGADGRWSLKIGPLEASSEGRDLVVAGRSSTRTLKDVLVGDVWLCGGQSNMEWQLRSTRDADVEIPCADYPDIRFIRLPKIARSRPQDDFPVKSPTDSEGNWRRCVPEQVENCTGVGYYFARRLHRRLRVPIGLVDTSWGGTMAQHWVPTAVLRPTPEMAPYFGKFEAAVREWEDGGGEAGAKRRYAAAVAEYERKRAAPRKAGERAPRQPNARSYEDPSRKGQPGGMFNGCIAPISPLAIKGILFYQGENNSFTVGWKPFPYTFPAVIAEWRKAFGDDDLPFGIVQIAGWSNRRGMTYDMNHHCNIVREVQFNAWRATPHTGLIMTFDTNSSGGIHPRRKVPVGERAARWALAEVHGVKRHGSKEPLEWRGPVYKSMEVKGGRIEIAFEEGTARGLLLDQDVEVGFYIAGEDREFHHARARVDRGKGKLTVWSDEVPEPVAVRYGWSNLPAGGLMNSRELPAYPFRTDTWPMTPHQSTGSYDVTKLRR
ncbi:MAG: sialate O-acetylesterase [Planctomycetota bacterium]|jgi:sialate O-acetylesterase